MSNLKALGAVAFLVGLVALLVYSGIDIHRIKEECKRDHGLVVKGAQTEDETGFSGYVCIEKGQHP